MSIIDRSERLLSAILARVERKLLGDQLVHVFDRFKEFGLEFLHHGASRFHRIDHADTLASQGNLAHAYHTAGRLTEALTIFERTLADCEQALGPGHPLTQAARENYQAAAKT